MTIRKRTFTALVPNPEDYFAGETLLLGSSITPERFAYEVSSVSPADGSGLAVAELRRMPCATCAESTFSEHGSAYGWICSECFDRYAATGSPYARSRS